MYCSVQVLVVLYLIRKPEHGGDSPAPNNTTKRGYTPGVVLRPGLYARPWFGAKLDCLAEDEHGSP